MILERGQPDDRVLVVHDVVDHRLHQTLGVAQVGPSRWLRRGAGSCACRAPRARRPASPGRAPTRGWLLSSSSRSRSSGVDLGGRDRHDVLDARLFDRLVQMLGDGRIVGGHEELEEALELGDGDLLVEADPAERAPLELRHQRVIEREQRRLDLDAHAVQVEVVGDRGERRARAPPPCRAQMTPVTILSWRWNAWFETSWVRAVRIMADSRTRSWGPSSASELAVVVVRRPSCRGDHSRPSSLIERVLARLAHRARAAIAAPRSSTRLRLRRSDPGDAAGDRLAVGLVVAREPVALDAARPRARGSTSSPPALASAASRSRAALRSDAARSSDRRR